MLDLNKDNQSLRFFSNASLVKSEKQELDQAKDPKPFGLNFQEEVKNDTTQPGQDGVTTATSMTNTPSSTDSCFDLDYEF